MTISPGPSREPSPEPSPGPSTGGWRQTDGTAVACREKLKLLEENHRELAQMLQDAFDDAILMGVDEAMIRQVFAEMVRDLRSPKRPA